MKTSRNFRFVLAAILVAVALMFGACSKMNPVAPMVEPTPAKPDTVVVIVNPPTDPGTGGTNPNPDPNNNGTDDNIRPPVASFWRVDTDGVTRTYVPTWFMTHNMPTKPPEPWWLDPVPEWVLANKGMDGVRALGHKFRYAGEIELAPGSVWDCHVVDGKFPSFQMEADNGVYSSAGLAGNFIAEGRVDPNNPALPGAYANPPTYYYTPVPWGSWL